MGLTPSFKILNEAGKELTELMRRVLSITATDESGQKNDKLDLVLYNDRKFLHPNVGFKVQLFLGYLEEGLYKVGNYTLTTVEYNGDSQDEKVILNFKSASANTALLDNKTRSFVNKSVGYIVNKICLESSLQPRIDPYFFTVNVNKDQSGITNQRLLFDLGQEHDAFTKIQGNVLVFARRGPDTLINSLVQLPRLNLEYKRDILTYSGQEDKSVNFSSVGVKYRAVASNGDITTEVASVGTGEPLKILNEIAGNEEDALRKANTAYNQISRGKRKLNISTEGRFRIPAETRVNVTGLPDILNGNYAVIKVMYNYSKKGDYTVSYELNTHIPATESNPRRVILRAPEDALDNDVDPEGDGDDILPGLIPTEL